MSLGTHKTTKTLSKSRTQTTRTRGPHCVREWQVV